MATQFANGKIVTNGLVLCLDAADLNSYPTTGTTWFDLAGSNNGTLTNGPTFSGTGASSSIVFDGTNDYVLSNLNTNLNEQSMTVSFFFKNLTTPDWTDFVSLIDTSNQSLVFEKGGNNGFPLTNGYIKVYPTNTYVTSLVDILTTGFFVQNSNIHYITLTTSPTQWNLYSETGLYASGSVSGTTNYFNKISVGTDYSRTSGSPRYSKCNFYVVQIYNRALSAQEVLQNYNAQKARFGIS
jgi:hypothetical protein